MTASRSAAWYCNKQPSARPRSSYSIDANYTWRMYEQLMNTVRSLHMHGARNEKVVCTRFKLAQHARAHGCALNTPPCIEWLARARELHLPSIQLLWVSVWPRRTRPRAKASMQSGWRVHSGRPDASHPHPRAHRCSAPRACSSVSSPPRRFADRLRVRASVHVTLMQSGCALPYARSERLHAPRPVRAEAARGYTQPSRCTQLCPCVARRSYTGGTVRAAKCSSR